MTAVARQRQRQTTALVALLKALPEEQLVDVLQGVGAALDVPTGGKPLRVCGICFLVYPKHVQRWGNDDHPFEPTERRR